MFRARDLLVRQRTQCVNALRGHLMEYGYVFPKGITHVETLVALVEDLPSSLPDSVRVILKLFVDTFTALEAQITALYAEINQRSKSDPTARRAPHSIQHYRLLASAWKHFEGLPRLPRGVVCALRECSANSPAPARHAPFGTAARPGAIVKGSSLFL